MLALSLRGMATRKLRTALTAFAVVLGVALVSGTYMLTDTINSSFDRIFTESAKGTDAELKAWAEAKLPTLREHLKMARDLRSKLGS